MLHDLVVKVVLMRASISSRVVFISLIRPRHPSSLSNPRRFDNFVLESISRMMGIYVFRSLSVIMILRLLQTTNMIAALKNDRSVAEAYFEIFDENVTPLDKRGYQRSARLLSFVETPRSAEDLPGFNLSMDVSGCGRSVQMNTVAGIYTYFNGTVHDNATVGDILADIKSIKNRAHDPQAASNSMGSHAIGTARLLERQISNLLVRRLLCGSPLETTIEERIHNELRHLLWSEQTQETALRFGKKLFIMLAASVVVGSALGGTISLATLIPHADGNNCDSSGVHNPECNPHYIEDTRRMGLEIGVATGLMLFTFLVISAMIVAISKAVAGGYHRGEEAFLALVWLTTGRRHVADLQEWLLESSRRQSALVSTPIRSFTSTSSSTSSTGTRPFRQSRQQILNRVCVFRWIQQ